MKYTVQTDCPNPTETTSSFRTASTFKAQTVIGKSTCIDETNKKQQ